MTMLLAFTVIVVAFLFSFFPLSTLLVNVLYDLPLSMKLQRAGLIKEESVKIHYIKTLVLNLVAFLVIPILAYVAYIFGSGFFISCVIGFVAGVIFSSYKIFLFSTSKDKSQWIGMYKKENATILADLNSNEKQKFENLLAEFIK